MTETNLNSSAQLLSGLICDWLEFSTLAKNRSSVDDAGSKKATNGKPTIGDSLPASTFFSYVESRERKERLRIKNLLKTAIEKCHVKDNSEAIAEKIESCLFTNYFYSFEAVYYLKARMLCENLAKNGAYLLQHYDPEILCYFPSEALASGTELEEWRDHFKYMFEQKLLVQESKRRGVFECQSCHSKNTDYYELQTRSADEPATIFINCFDCGKHFRR